MRRSPRAKASARASPIAAAPSIEWNWLGTDDQGRDVVARLIYGFRISVLFGLILATISSVVGVAAGAVQGYFGGWVDLVFQRFIEIWSSLPQLYLLDHHLVLHHARLLRAARHPAALLVGVAGACRARRVPARRATSNMSTRRARSGCRNRKIIVKHLLPNAMVATLTFLPFILNSSITTLTSLDFLGFGLPPGSPSLGELLLQGKSNLQAPWLGLTGFVDHRADAVAARLHRRSGARRLRSEKDLPVTDVVECRRSTSDEQRSSRNIIRFRGFPKIYALGSTPNSG